VLPTLLWHALVAAVTRTATPGVVSSGLGVEYLKPVPGRFEGGTMSLAAEGQIENRYKQVVEGGGIHAG
jgi:hypothetical protein